jgi:hypothetical protein
MSLFDIVSADDVVGDLPNLPRNLTSWEIFWLDIQNFFSSFIGISLIIVTIIIIYDVAVPSVKKQLIMAILKPFLPFFIALISWVFCVGLYVWLFEPYGYMNKNNWWHLLKVIVFPIVISGVVYLSLISIRKVK